MKNLLAKLLSGAILTDEEAAFLMRAIINKEANDAQLVAAITALIMRPISVKEIIAFRNVLMSMALVPEIDASQAIDVCGTGGDGKNTFNISTTSAFVIAAAGYKVVKHGNYGVSSNCGSSTVLEALGYQFTTDSNRLQTELDECNICFLHAPLFHPALKNVGKIRSDLGIRSFFNYLGPLLNPVQPAYQLAGVYNQKLVRVYQEILDKERKGYAIVHGLNGFDELSLTDDFILAQRGFKQQFAPSDLNLSHYAERQIIGGTNTKASADILRNILNGKGTKPQAEVVIANAALGIQCFDDNKSFKTAYEEAETALFDKSGNVINELLKISYEFA